MSVYTEVGRDDLIAFLADYDVGELVSFEGISDGIENTNYFVTTDKAGFVLTLFEQHEFEELGYFLDVMTFFYEQNIPSAYPAADKDGRFLKTLSGKPAALVHRLQGRGVNSVASLKQCEVMGDMLAKMHIAAPQFTGQRINGRGGDWRQSKGAELLPLLDAETAVVLKDELAFQADYQALGLPKGVSHSDLFRDNALFNDDELAGIIDFYYACDEYYVYDLAVVVNDWCVDEQGLVDHSRYQRLMNAYQAQRPLSVDEQDAWPMMLRAAALRFWLSRLQDKLFPKEGELTQIKDPDAILKILKQHRNSVLALAS
jgi:homoserine kinase type II